MAKKKSLAALLLVMLFVLSTIAALLALFFK